MAEFDYKKWFKDEIGVQLKPCTCGNNHIQIVYFQEQIFARCVGMNGCGKRSKALLFEGGGNTLPEQIFKDGANIAAYLWNDGQYDDEANDT